MGLIPSAEVPSPILVVEEAHFVEFDPATERLLMTARGFHDVTVEEIVEFHGERPPAREADRHFCAAFVLFSDERLPEADMARLETWAKVFGNVEPSGFLQSFESATGGRATMDVRLGTPR